MTVKKGTYKVDNGSTYDEIMFKTLSEQVFFSDGQTFQDKLNNGTLKGPTGPTGDQGPTGPKGDTGSPGVNATTTAIVSTSANGLAPKVTNTSYFLRGDGTWQAANNYSHPTTDGNKHIPNGGAANQWVKWNSAGTGTWSLLPSSSTTTTGIVQLNDAINSTSTTQAATANAVKKAYDRAELAFQNANNGKNAIANVIGSPVTSSDTWDSMSDKVKSMKSTLATNINSMSYLNCSSTDSLNTLASNTSKIKFSSMANIRITGSIGPTKPVVFSVNGYINKRTSRDKFMLLGKLVNTDKTSVWFGLSEHPQSQLISTSTTTNIYSSSDNNIGTLTVTYNPTSSEISITTSIHSIYDIEVLVCYNEIVVNGEFTPSSSSSSEVVF